MQEGGFKILLPGPRDGKILLRSSASCKKEFALEVGCGGVWNLSKGKNFLDSVILSWSKQ